MCRTCILMPLEIMARNSQQMSLRILGIDPGFGRTGLGVVDIKAGVSTYVWHDVIETDKSEDFSARLRIIRDDIQEAIRRFHPQCAAVESLFFQTNVRTAMKVGMARGVILLTLADAGIPIVELNPNQVKQGIAGYGSADKKQVLGMVVRLLKLKTEPKLDDASDALALAIVGGYAWKTGTIR